MPDQPTILDIDGFSFRTHTSAISGIPTAPPRPPACHDPMSQVEGFADATLGVEVAVRRLQSLREDLEAEGLALRRLDEAKTELMRTIGRSDKASAKDVVKLDHQRQERLAQAQIIEGAIKVAQGDVEAARDFKRRVLRAAGEHLIELMRERANEALADEQAAKRRAQIYEFWIHEDLSRLRGSKTEDELLALLGIA